MGAKDLEDSVIGEYDNSQLEMIDNMLPRAAKYRIKLVIAIHDRYSLGVWAMDAYAKAYNYPFTNGNARQGSLDRFYKDSNGIAAFERRMQYVLTYKSKTMGGASFGSLSNVIQSFNIENESQGHLAVRYTNWLCDRAQTAKKFVSNGVLVSTGGGVAFWDSLDETNFKCPYIDVIAIHSYDGIGSFDANLKKAASLATIYKKKIVLEEFGTTVADKSGFINAVAALANPLGIPMMIWQAMPANKGDFEFWADETRNWQALAKSAEDALKVKSQFAPKL
jgi:mannan endo-1,4-beta-mannosidase